MMPRGRPRLSAAGAATVALSFERLVTAIGQAHAELAAQASRAVNSGLTLRNWLIGLYIEEYERRGVDRQQYGEKLLDRLSESLNQQGVSRCDRRELYRYRQFYLAYPQIVETLPPQLARTLLPETDANNIRESLTPKLGVAASEVLTKFSFIEEQLTAGTLGETDPRHLTGGEAGSSEGGP